MSYKFDPWALETLIHWITQREGVRTMREAGELPPWTADPIIAEWRFCNVNRCDDKETKWIFQYVIAEHATSSVIVWMHHYEYMRSARKDRQLSKGCRTILSKRYCFS